ncbi:hypothetical protein ABZ723_03785 [Streptomyces sp. NPDC006700]|uniref:hypothetical protein n=1 Tax=Streptomyces sp. NPDC006700 TaxID=3154479 RepID=UPI0033C5DE81
MIAMWSRGVELSHERESAPDGLRRVLQDLIDAMEEEGMPTLAEWLDVPRPTDLWANDVGRWIGDKLQRLPDPQVYDFIESALSGSSHYDERVNKILRSNDIALSMVDGAFYEDDEAAEDYGVEGAAEQPVSLLRGKYAAAGTMWAKALTSHRAGDDKQAVALAVNTLEGVVKIASGKKDINAGLRFLFPEGERGPLRSAINQLHNYGSAMPWVRHGGGIKDLELDRIEARGVLRSSAVWIVMLVNLDSEGDFA